MKEDKDLENPAAGGEPGADLGDLAAQAPEAEPQSEQDRQAMEEAVLSAVAISGMESKDLWEGFHRLTWSRMDFAEIAKAIRTCIEEDLNGKPADPILVRKRLKDDKVSVSPKVLKPILDGSKAKNVKVARLYVQKLIEYERRRRVLEALQEATKKVEGGDMDAAVYEIVKTLANSGGTVSGYVTEAEEMPDFMRNLADRNVQDRKYLGLDSGFDHLNEVFNGLTPGLYVLAGAPSTGKTTLAKQVADQVAENERVPVLFFSYEQSKEELRIKSLSRLADVDSRKIWKGRMYPDEWKKVEEAAEEYRKGPGNFLTIIEAGRTDTVDAIRTAALAKKHEAGGGRVLIILDYLQIMPPPEDTYLPNIKDRVDYNLSELRRLSRELDSPILAVSSENREAYKGNKEPTMAALKESGGIEYTADAVICLWRNKDETESLTRNYERKTVRVELRVLKNRNGELANIKTDFTPAWALFMEQGKEGLDYDAALGD